MTPVMANHSRSPVLRNRQSYRRLGETTAISNVSSLMTLHLYRSLRAKQLENQTHHRDNTLAPREVLLFFGNHWAHHCSQKNVSAITFTQINTDLSQTISIAVS